MMIDVTRAIGAVTREVSSREVDGQQAWVLVATRVYDAPRADLWDALTNPGRLPRWFAPVSGDFRLGGRYQVEGNAGGEITRCEPPQHLALTWEMHGAVSWVDVRLTEESGGRTQLYLEHTAHVPDDFWKQFGPGAVGVGWEQALLGLDQHFSTEASVSPDNAEAWIASDNGREFIKASSDAWADASMASGTPAAAAREAGERTRAFYTGDTPAG